MKHLLDVNVLIAGTIATHVQHKQAVAWLAGKSIVLCPLSELGFLRISTNPKILGFTMPDTRRLLENFATLTHAERIPADLSALESRPHTFEQVTDHYLADLAAEYGFKLATFDRQLKHPAVELVR